MEKRRKALLPGKPKRARLGKAPLPARLRKAPRQKAFPEQSRKAQAREKRKAAVQAAVPAPGQVFPAGKHRIMAARIAIPPMRRQNRLRKTRRRKRLFAENSRACFFFLTYNKRERKKQERTPAFETAAGVFRVTLPNCNEAVAIKGGMPEQKTGKTAAGEQEKLVMEYVSENGSITRQEAEELLQVGST